MAKPYFVKFDVPENLVSPIYEALRVASETGKVKKGTNEATKAIERGVSKLIIIAEDVDHQRLLHIFLLFVKNEEQLMFLFQVSKS
jgi:large subunit ribosomal protein L7Ae